MVLPEDLRSELLKSYGRDEFANYHRNILEAIEVWRQLGVWRVPSTGDRLSRTSGTGDLPAIEPYATDSS